MWRPAVGLVLAALHLCFVASFVRVEWRRPAMPQTTLSSRRLSHQKRVPGKGRDGVGTNKRHVSTSKHKGKENDASSSDRTDRQPFYQQSFVQMKNTCHTPQQVKEWFSASTNKQTSSLHLNWSISDLIELIKFLQKQRLFDEIFLVVSTLSPLHVKVATTAMFALAQSPKHRRLTTKILLRLDEQGIAPTTLTFVAWLKSARGAEEVRTTMRSIFSYKNVKLNEKVFETAMYVIGSESHRNDWREALNLMQEMRRRRLTPTSTIFQQTLRILGRARKLSMARSIIDQMKLSTACRTDQKTWLAAINVYGKAADCEGAIGIVKEMQELGLEPNLKHCTALLNAFAVSGEYQLAESLIAMMMDQPNNDIAAFGLNLHIGPTFPDLIALNTVVAAYSKASNSKKALVLFEKMKAADFIDPDTKTAIKPDVLTYHSLLVSCGDPKFAKNLIQEMRLSRRHRYDTVPPSSVTYAHAIAVCQKARPVDLETIQLLLSWADDDGINATEYMLSSAVWAAQKVGNTPLAIEYFDRMRNGDYMPNSVAYSGIICALCDSSELEDALQYLLEAKAYSFTLSRSVFSHLVSGVKDGTMEVDELAFLERIFGCMSAEEQQASIGGPIFEELILRSGQAGNFDRANAIFEQIRGPSDAKCLRAILLASSQSDPPRWLDAVTILHTSDILEDVNGPGRVDQVALSYAIVSCCQAEEVDEALNLLHLYGIPARQRRKNDAFMTTFAMNALIAGYRRHPDMALAVLNDLQSEYGVRANARTYRDAIMICNQAEHKYRRHQLSSEPNDTSEVAPPCRWWESALALLRRMQEDGLKPDTISFSSTISACEAAGEWQRAIGVLQAMMDLEHDEEGSQPLLNRYCFNAAISACEKGGAWMEALEIYYRMIDYGGSVTPNFVTLGSLIIALDNAGQKELARSVYAEGAKLKIVDGWKPTTTSNGERVQALDLHRFSAALARAAVRHTVDKHVQLHVQSLTAEATVTNNEILLITGKGLHSVGNPVIQKTVIETLHTEYGLSGRIDGDNTGRVVVNLDSLKDKMKKYGVHDTAEAKELFTDTREHN